MVSQNLFYSFDNLIFNSKISALVFNFLKEIVEKLAISFSSKKTN